jgi:hypothetical protein
METRTTIALTLLALAAGCSNDSTFRLGDDWSTTAAGRYVVGTTTGLHLTELVPNPDYEPSLIGGYSLCAEYDCLRLDDDDFRVTSSDPGVFEIEERGGWIGRARSVGEARIEARRGGEVVASVEVKVAVPERTELSPSVLERVAHGNLFRDDRAPIGPRIPHVAGGVLELDVSHWVGDVCYRSSAPMVVETALPVQMVLDWPPRSIRILDAEPGIEELVIEVAGHREIFELESYAPTRIDRMEMSHIWALADVPRADTWYVFSQFAEGETVWGLAPLAWHVNGRPVGEGGILACAHRGDGPAEVEARLGERIERFVIEEGCDDPAVVPWLDPLPEWFAPR